MCEARCGPVTQGNTRNRVLLVNNPRFASRAPRSQPIQASRAAHLPRRRAEQCAAHRPSRAVAYQVPHVLAHCVAVTQVVIAAQQAVEQPQVLRTRFDHTHANRPQITQRAADGLSRMIHQGRVAISQSVGRRSPALRQPDVATSLQLQKQRARGHILDASLCVAPVPQAAKLFAEPGSAPVLMFSQEPLDQSDILSAQFPALHYHDAFHGSHGTP